MPGATGDPGRRLTLAAVAFTIAVSSGFVVARLAPVHWDPSRFVSAGHVYVPNGSQGLVRRDPLGYDGQFFFRLARDPFTSSPTEFGIQFDHPARRQQRILYPFLVWILSGGGHVRAVLWLMVWLNVAAVGLVALAGSALARNIGRSPLAGVLFAAIPGLVISLTFDTPEPVALALALWGYVLLRRGRFFSATTLLTAAALTRETTLLFALGLLAVVMVKRFKREAYELAGRPVPLAAPLLPMVMYAAWQAGLWAIWGKPAVLESGQSDLGAPFLSLFREIASWSSRPPRVRIDNAFFLFVLIAFLAWVIPSLRRSIALPHEKAALVLSLVLLVCFQRTIWYHYANFLRALGETFALGLIVVMGDGTRALTPSGVATAPIWGYLAYRARLLD